MRQWCHMVEGGDIQSDTLVCVVSIDQHQQGIDFIRKRINERVQGA